MVLPELPGLWPKMHKDKVSQVEKEPDNILKKMIEGLIETIRIVETNLPKLKEENKENVEKALNEAMEVLQKLGKEVGGGRGEEPQQQIDIKKLKEDIDNLIKRVKEQRDLFVELQGEEVIDIKAEKKLEEQISRIDILKGQINTPLLTIDYLKNNFKNILKEIQDLFKIEKRMSGKQTLAVRRLVNKENEITALIEEVQRITKILFNLIQGKADETNLSQHTLEISRIYNSDLIKLREENSKEREAIRKLILYMKNRQVLEDRIMNNMNGFIRKVDSFKEENVQETLQEIDTIKQAIKGIEDAIKTQENAIVRCLTELKEDIRRIFGALENLEKELVELKKALKSY